MIKSAHKAAVDQAYLLAAYLDQTPSSSLDLSFIRRHLDTLSEFVQAAKADTASHGDAILLPQTGLNYNSPRE